MAAAQAGSRLRRRHWLYDVYHETALQTRMHMLHRLDNGHHSQMWRVRLPPQSSDHEHRSAPSHHSIYALCILGVI